MLSREKWFDRVFELAIPVSLMPNVLERLRGTPARLEERIPGIPPEIRLAGPDGGWSIQETVGHLLDLEPLWAGRLDDLVAGAEELRPADLTNAKTHGARHNNAGLTDLLARFRELRTDFVARLDALTDDQLLVAAAHPRLKQPMRAVDLAFFVAEHDDHHLATISEAIGEAGSSS